MKILMFGRGVIAALYGWALEKAGHAVDFYVRPGRAAEYGPTLDLQICDARKPLKAVPVAESWPVRLREDLPHDHDYELIIVSVQHYRFAEVAAFLGPRAGNATILLFNNFWADPQTAAAPLPAQQLAWGFPMAGGGFAASGVLKGSLFHQVQFGTFGSAATARELAVRALFRHSGFALTEQKDFRGWLWLHFILNAGLHTQTLQVGSMPRLMESAAHVKSAILNIRELLPVVAARGIDLKAHPAEVTLVRLPPWLTSVAITGIMKFLAPVRFLIESHTNQEELRVTCRDVLDEARRLGISIPRLAAAERFFAPGSSSR